VIARRILIVEDNEELAFGLRRTLESEGFLVEVATTGPRGIAAARQHEPALLILDVMLPGADGFSVLKTLRDDGFAVPVLMLTAKSEEADKVYGFRVGADDYVTKPFGLSELIARVGALLRRGPPRQSSETESPSVFNFGDVVVNATARTITKRGRAVALTPREFDLLHMFVRRPGAVLSRDALLRDVWGASPDVMTRTVDIHVGELRRKLEKDPSAPRHFVTVRKAGYRFDAGE
jgi:DNA-binding response OmpR family regulator